MDLLQKPLPTTFNPRKPFLNMANISNHSEQSKVFEIYNFILEVPKIFGEKSWFLKKSWQNSFFVFILL